MRLIACDWYDGPLAGFAFGLPVYPEGPCRFECIASIDDHAYDERIFVIAPIAESDMQEAIALEESAACMMPYSPEGPNSNRAVAALVRRTRDALTHPHARIFFAFNVTADTGLVCEIGRHVEYVVRALDQEHPSNGKLDDWVDVRSTAIPLVVSTP